MIGNISFHQYQGIKQLMKLGFDVIGATWYKPDNISTFAKYMKNIGGKGLLQTTWAGHFGSTTAFSKDLKQYSVHLWSAEMLWNAEGNKQIEDLPYRPEKLFLKNIRKPNGNSIPVWGHEW
ncbi:hypothetical protein CULT_300026 [[Clostridium] ultunense Esp]|nr:hypothetical protein CULT_300026 [[Clostridium] ultunense Esp]